MTDFNVFIKIILNFLNKKGIKKKKRLKKEWENEREM